jgi:hypothetical protein
MVIVQAPTPVQAPLQPVNENPVEGVAVSVTDVPESKFAVHVDPQSIPATEDVTVPVPDFVTVTANCGGTNAAILVRMFPDAS